MFFLIKQQNYTRTLYTSARRAFFVLKISRSLSREKTPNFPQKNVIALLLLSDDAFFAPRVFFFHRVDVVVFVSESSALFLYLEVASSTSF